MRKKFQQFIKENHLCSKNDKVLLALSGGIDSVVLLSLFRESGYKIAIAHCNFKLRGKESDADEDFVRKLAKDLDVELFVKVCDAAKYADENKVGIQEAARDLRYFWFDEVDQKQSFDCIAIAHHADDQTETFFINLLRGSGVSGLKGIPLQRGKIIRPLLFADRSDIENYANKNQLEFREDSSNASDKYLRNDIRHNLLPKLEDLVPEAKKSIAASLQYLQEDDLMLKLLLKEKRENLFVPRGGNIEIPIDELKQLHPLETWLYYLLKEFNFKREVVQNLCFTLQTVEHTSSGKIFHSASHQLLIDRQNILIQKKKQRTDESFFEISKTTTEIFKPLHLRLAVEENSDNYTFENMTTTAYFDFQKLQFPLTVRKWKKGDRFVPFGMKGSKLISDFFIDNKIDRFAKQKIWLLLSGDEVIWIIGHRSSGKFRVRKACAKILQAKIVDLKAND